LSNRTLTLLLVGLAIVIWAGPLHLGWYVDRPITDIPTYEAAWHAIAGGQVPYRDFSLEYPPLAAGLFWLAGALPGDYAVTFSALMCLCLIATLLGVLATARALDLDRRRQALAGGAVAVSPLLLGNMVETRFDLLLAAFLAWMLYAAVAARWRLMWGLFAAATLTKLIPLVLLPALIVWQRHRAGSGRAWRGAAAAIGAVALVVLPFAVLSPSGTWDIARYHLDRPLQVESIGSAYLMGLHVLADVPVHVSSSYGSQGIDGRGPDVIATLTSVAALLAIVAVAATLLVLLRRTRAPADARLLVAAVAASTALLLAGGKVLSPQFLIWLLPSVFLVTGRYGSLTFALAILAMTLTQAYFPAHYWDLVALDRGPIGLLVLRDLTLLALVAAAWPRPGIARPEGRLLPQRATPASAGAAERAVAGRFLS
jgi:hypothetical protein